jgi:protein gp37
MEEKWVIDIRDQVKEAGLPFMFKHWPGKNHNAREALLEGRIWAEYPESVEKNTDWNTLKAL